MMEEKKGHIGWVIVVVPVLALSTTTSFLMGFGSGYGVRDYCAGLTKVVPAAPVKPGKSSELTPEQSKNGQLIIGVGQNRGIPLQGIKIALMTAKQECNLLNCAFGDRDSLGLFQQRPSQGWGTAAQILDPIYAINKFYSALEKVQGWQNMSLMDAALEVQNPNPAAYVSVSNNFNWWESIADALLSGVKPLVQISGQDNAPSLIYDEACADVSTPADALSEVQGESGGEWTRPIPTTTIGSPYGQRYHPILHYWRLHDGIDLGASTGTPIKSIGNGTLVFRGYNSGAGNHVRVDYGDGYVASFLHLSRFAHQQPGDKVKVGEVIGYIGSTGLSTAPHLHLGMKKDGKSIDPVPQLCKWGIRFTGAKGNCSPPTL